MLCLEKLIYHQNYNSNRALKDLITALKIVKLINFQSFFNYVIHPWAHAIELI